MARIAKHNLCAQDSRTWRRSSRRSDVRTSNLSSTSNGTTLLWIDDFAPALELYKASMETLGFKIFTAASGEAGVKLAAVKRVDLVITDYEMPGMNGQVVAAMIKSMNPAIPVIIFSGSTLISHRPPRYADAFCDKAASREQLLNTIQRLLHRKRISTLQPPPPIEASHHERRTVA